MNVENDVDTSCIYCAQCRLSGTVIWFRSSLGYLKYLPCTMYTGKSDGNDRIPKMILFSEREKRILIIPSPRTLAEILTSWCEIVVNKYHDLNVSGYVFEFFKRKEAHP